MKTILIIAALVASSITATATMPDLEQVSAAASGSKAVGDAFSLAVVRTLLEAQIKDQGSPLAVVSLDLDPTSNEISRVVIATVTDLRLQNGSNAQKYTVFVKAVYKNGGWSCAVVKQVPEGRTVATMKTDFDTQTNGLLGPREFVGSHPH